ncbi:hypothetical protein HYV80_07060 [Candidatus Woesearchaeota archaeon]|nr:hypothetical protein [Candidatus Woesearchaeota archaeon]
MKIKYKFLVLIVVLILIINITLLALNKINEILFWAVIAVAAVFAYVILPKMKAKLNFNQ